MARKLKKEYERREEYYVEIEKWTRKYSVGINRHPWEFNQDRFSEWNTVVVTGKIRHIHSDVRARRKYERLSVYIFSSSSPISKWNQEANSIGGVWVEDGVLCCGAHMPPDAFVTMVPSLAAECFKEVMVVVLDLKYHKGRTDEICLRPELTPMEGLV